MTNNSDSIWYVQVVLDRRKHKNSTALPQIAAATEAIDNPSSKSIKLVIYINKTTDKMKIHT
jgi:hypothetical protein